jgi:hypothetical protein
MAERLLRHDKISNHLNLNGASQHLPKLTLASFKARVGFVDDVDTAFAANQTVLTVTGLERFKRILDLHISNPRGWRVSPRNFTIKSALTGALIQLAV